MSETRIGQGGILERVFSQEDYDNFAELSGDDNPIHTDPGYSALTRFGRTVCHGMFLFATLNRTISTKVSIPGIVPVSVELTFPNPLFTDEKAIFLTWITNTRDEDGLIDFDMVVSKQDGTVICQGDMEACLPSKYSELESERCLEKNKSDKDTSLMGLEIGQKAQISRTYTKKDIKKRSKLTGDTNPIFLSEDFSKEYEFESSIVPPDLIGTSISALLGTELPGPGTGWLKQSFEFPDVLPVGKEITAEVEITGIRPEKNLVDLWNSCVDPDGNVVCKGKSLVFVQDL